MKKADADQYKIEAEARARAEEVRVEGLAKAEIEKAQGQAKAEVQKAQGTAEADVIRLKGLAEAEAKQKLQRHLSYMAKRQLWIWYLKCFQVMRRKLPVHLATLIKLQLSIQAAVVK